MRDRTICARCSGRLEVIRDTPPSRHWGWLVCSRCAHRQSRVPTPLEHIDSYTMPFGRHANRTLTEIAAVDRPYLEWAAANLNAPRLRQVVQIFLEHHGAMPGPPHQKPLEKANQ